MILFSIICKSCASKLNVSKTSAIGQILACPKCGTMIEVIPPENWQAPAGLETPGNVQSDTTTGSFDDIDSILNSPQTTGAATGKISAEKVRELTKKSAQKIAKQEAQEKAEQNAIQQIRKLPTTSPKSKSNKSSKSTTGKKRHAKMTGVKTDNAAAAIQTPAEQPILPTEQWTSPETQQRKKMVRVVAAVLGAVLLCGAGIAAVMNMGKSDAGRDQQIADRDANQVASVESPDDPKTIDPDSQNISPDVPGDEANAADPNGTDSQTIEPGITDPNILSEENDPTTIGQTDVGVDPTAIAEPPPILDPDSKQNPAGVSDMPPPLMTDVTDQGTPDDPPNLTNNASPIGNGSPIGNSSPIGNGSPGGADLNPDVTPNPLGNLDSMETELGALSQLLDQSDSSLMELQDIAAASRERQLVGLPKYFIEKPDPEKIDAARQLSLPCSGIRYTDTNLITIFRDIDSITGVPVTLDTSTILSSSPTLTPKIDVDLKEMEYGAVIDAIAQQLGLQQTITENQHLMIHGPNPDRFVKQTHKLPNFPPAKTPTETGTDLTDAGGKIIQHADPAKHFVASVQGLFSPQSWVQQVNPATIELSGNEIVVNNTQLVQHQIENFVTKIQSAIDLTADLNDANARKALVNRWDAINERLQQPAGLQITPDRLLVDLLSQMQRDTGIAVLVDWHNLLPLGWTPTTKVPGNIEEKNVESVLTEIASAMRLTIRAVDDSTLELTTFEKSASAPDLEIYHFGNALKKLNEKQALRLIDNTLGPQLQSPYVRYVYEPKCQCLVLLAPQPVQKQMSAVLAKLENL